MFLKKTDFYVNRFQGRAKKVTSLPHSFALKKKQKNKKIHAFYFILSGVWRIDSLWDILNKIILVLPFLLFPSLPCTSTPWRCRNKISFIQRPLKSIEWRLMNVMFFRLNSGLQQHKCQGNIVWFMERKDLTWSAFIVLHLLRYTNYSLRLSIQLWFDVLTSSL